MKSASQGSLFQTPARDTSLRVGPAGWNYKDWEGIVYPSGAGKSFDALTYLAEFFDTVEINSSFYAPPRSRDATAWARRVRNNPRFRFTAKAWQKLSHDREEATEASIAADCEVVRRSLAPLAEAGILGALLVQFPWSFRHTEENLAYLESLFRRLAGYRLALEVRHGSWDREEFYAFLRESDVAFCNVDQPVIGDSMEPSGRVTSRLGYLRLHGRNYRTWFEKDAGRDERYDYLYTKAEIKEVSGRLRIMKQEADETYAITNNHFRGQALVNAIEILEELDAQPPAVPSLLARAYPRLAEVGRGGPTRPPAAGN
ncbi:MAG: DUF72 domain-containing protein [Acidobacteriia bacterium]|nr:DUF72 domain-containing protein [Terriglobia bacterium]